MSSSLYHPTTPDVAARRRALAPHTHEAFDAFSRAVFSEGELERGSNTKNICIASSARPVTLYSLDVIISVGYRVKSHRGTQFRIWATRTLKERLVQSYRERRRIEGRGAWISPGWIDLHAHVWHGGTDISVRPPSSSTPTQPETCTGSFGTSSQPPGS